MSRVADRSTISYLGFPVEIVGEHRLIVRDPDSDRVLLDGRYTLSGARRFIRGYRRPAGTLSGREPSTAGSTAGSPPVAAATVRPSRPLNVPHMNAEPAALLMAECAAGSDRKGA